MKLNATLVTFKYPDCAAAYSLTQPGIEGWVGLAIVDRMMRASIITPTSIYGGDLGDAIIPETALRLWISQHLDIDWEPVIF